MAGFLRPFWDCLHLKTFSCFGTACCRLQSNSLWVGCLSWWVLCDTSLKTAVCVCQDDSVLAGFYYEKHRWPLKSKGHIYEWLSLFSVWLKLTVCKQKPKHTSPMQLFEKAVFASGIHQGSFPFVCKRKIGQATIKGIVGPSMQRMMIQELK